MLSEVLSTLQAKKPEIVEALVARVVATVPLYAAADPRELRLNVDGLFDDMLAFLEVGDRTAYSERIVALSKARIAQGFTPTDVLQALLVGAPVLRDIIRTVAPASDPSVLAAFSAVEAAIHELAATAASLYVDHVGRQMKSKNDELFRLNQRLVAQDEMLSLEVVGMSKALGNAQTFLRCTIDSLSSGLIVVEAGTRRITLYSARAEQIIGIPAEEALGRDVVAAMGPLGGIDIQSIINTVLKLGRLPLMRLSLTREDGSIRHVSVRAQRVFDPAGEPKATVCSFDDVTREELLCDSIARFLPRETAQRVLALGTELPRERREVAVLIAEMRGYSMLAEALDPESLHESLDAFVRAAVDSVTTHGGFVDKISLGKVVAIFTSGELRNAVAGALRGAAELSRRMTWLDAERVERGEPRLAIGVGVEAGEVLLAAIGTEDRMELAAIGDPVSRADLLRGLARPGQVLVGAEAAALADVNPPLRDLGARKVPGRKSALDVFELVSAER